MPRVSVSRSHQIAVPRERVFATLRDFTSWPKFSPWLVSEPDCPLNFAEDGRSYSWQGEIIGTGSIEITEEDAPHRIGYRLSFIKPFKSESAVEFLCSERDGGTEVRWNLEGSMPFFLFWMTGMMEALCSSDYERGLLMLQDYLEQGLVLPPLVFADKPYGGSTVLGVRAASTTGAIGEAMQKAMGELSEKTQGSGVVPAGPPLSIYHKWDMKRREAEFTIGFPLADGNAPIPDGVTKTVIPPIDAFTVTHTGPYRHLGNAWSAGYGHRQARRFRSRKDVDPFEVYLNDPAEVDERDLVTVVHFPKK